MKYILTGGEVVTPHQVIHRGTVVVENERIKSVSDLPTEVLGSGHESIDCSGRMVMPGFIDVHTHGGRGYDFVDKTPETCDSLSNHYYSHGVTTLLATISPLSHRLLLPAVRRIAKYCSENTGRGNILGIHLEGPYLNKAMRGGNKEEYFEKPSLQKWRDVYEAGQGFVRLMTVAPEVSGIGPVIEDAIAKGVVIALGHSTADGGTAIRAIDLGARQVTHLFNSMPTLHHREPGLLSESLLSDKVDAQLIADGVHVHPRIIMLAIKTKGIGHIMLITDSIRATEMGDGEYYSAGKTVSVEKGVVHLADGTLAGSTLVLEKALRLLLTEIGVGLPEASQMLSSNAARSLGIYGETGSLEEGKRADLVVLDRNFNVQMTMRAGEIKYRGTSDAAKA